METKIKNNTVQVLVPLRNFHIDFENYDLTQNIRIKKRTFIDINFDEGNLKRELSLYEIKLLDSEEFWLEFEYEEPSDITPNAIINIFLLSLWIVCPTNIYSTHYFKRSDSIQSVRILDRFVPLENKSNSGYIKGTKIKVIKDIFSKILSISQKKENSRLFFALVFSLRGHTTIDWSVAYICYMTSLEIILSYDDENKKGQTKRLSSAYACIMGTLIEKRNSLFLNFNKLYDIRCDIIHGRICNYKGKKSKNLDKLKKLETTSRKLWKKILKNDYLIDKLEKDYKSRKLFFEKEVINDYITQIK